LPAVLLCNFSFDAGQDNFSGGLYRTHLFFAHQALSNPIPIKHLCSPRKPLIEMGAVLREVLKKNWPIAGMWTIRGLTRPAVYSIMYVLR
jgi:hypothetical protein